jgi:hypothetical protein
MNNKFNIFAPNRRAVGRDVKEERRQIVFVKALFSSAKYQKYLALFG